ncbi:hypothetical protein EW146_g5315 [Bondarzewia mesenterica]|uniref:ATPase n=1 Tax=Bondarzewia mesenterica TaxID=1095465 RepID=A0A4S4LTR3_9AGAM|nr:hypothetical protein EW146_g5315 [Bondarzewia mesenterica]
MIRCILKKRSTDAPDLIEFDRSTVSAGVEVGVYNKSARKCTIWSFDFDYQRFNIHKGCLLQDAVHITKACMGDEAEAEEAEDPSNHQLRTFKLVPLKSASNAREMTMMAYGAAACSLANYIGSWSYGNFDLHIDHIQSDPFARPSKLRVQMKHEVAKYPHELFASPVRNIALSDFLTRSLHNVMRKPSSSNAANWSSAKGGDITIDKPGQQVLQRSSIAVDYTGIEARFTLGFPAQGRTILGDRAAEIFNQDIPLLARHLLYESQNSPELESFVESIEDQESLRHQIRQAGLSAFVANGAVLPRASGASDLPMPGNIVVKFQSPPNLQRSFMLPNRGRVDGMAIPEGITLIAGGGFHVGIVYLTEWPPTFACLLTVRVQGKSTLLDGLAVGCYNHIPGDGREFVVTSPSCVSVRGEDGRLIKNVDISPFINNLPGGASTTSFSTEDASGSTSMAAGVIEALELGADTILFDEDTCATNFLVRDRRMQKLISADPITPLIFKVRSMYSDHKCSSILVIGGCGDYCDVADLVLEMRNYQCYDITDAARQIAQAIPSVVADHEVSTFGSIAHRALGSQDIPPPGTKVTSRGRSAIQIADSTLDLSALTQLSHDSQTRAIAAMLKRLRSIQSERRQLTVVEALLLMRKLLDERGLNAIMEEGQVDGFLAEPRMIELGMAINRLTDADNQSCVLVHHPSLRKQLTLSIILHASSITINQQHNT